MFIDNETKRRVNIHFTYKGFSKLDTPEIRERANVVEIAEPTPPADYSDDIYYRTEQNDAPYVVFTPKSPEQLERILDDKNHAGAIRHLLDTDYLFTIDRHASLLTDEPQREADLRNSRELAREVIRAHKVKYPVLP